jgi:uncharacterized protein (TIGR02285 family)
MNDNLPPASIVNGPHRGEWIVDGLVSLYQEHLPEYEHQHLVANMARILFTMRQGQNACYAGFFKTPEREEYIYFSIPNIIAISNVIVVKKSRKETLFGDVEEVSLKDLLANRQLRLGLTKDRAYGNNINNVLAPYKEADDRLLFRAGQNSLQGLLHMLDSERIDYTIGFPWEVSYVAGQIGLTGMFGIVHIQEMQEHQWTYNYIGCTKNEWGYEVIRKINAILRELRPTEEHLYHQLKWFPKEMEEEIRQIYQEHILTVTE